jgi:YVTN family beta-propeller protein
VAVTPDGSKVYVANMGDGTVSVINTATSMVVATIPVGTNPEGVAVSPDGSKVYVTNNGDSSVSVINTGNDAVVATITVGTNPLGVAVTPDGSKAYVANMGDGTVSVIKTATNMAFATIPVGANPIAFGLFIQPAIGVFSAFTAKLTVSSFQPKFTLLSNFTLGSNSNGINPAFEAVTLKIGTFTVTIPPGSFTLTSPGTYSFFGVISGLTINAKITQTAGKAYTFQATANANLSRTKSPATVTLAIGNDTGTTTARFYQVLQGGEDRGRPPSPALGCLPSPGADMVREGVSVVGRLHSAEATEPLQQTAPAQDCSASRLALPPTAAVFTLTTCSSAKRRR